MNGAEALLRTLQASSVEVCFANPGTSEMHLVSALDRLPAMRGVLCLFEGVASGAADGYARMSGVPAATLLHLGPGLTNALANVHNAKRARSPMLNVVGDHATYHRPYDAPLTSDIEGLARPLSDWLRTTTAQQLPGDAAEAVAQARQGRIATLIVPADAAWSETADPLPPQPVPGRPRVEERAVSEVAAALRSGEPAAILIGGAALLDPALSLAARIASSTGVRLYQGAGTGRVMRGAGRPQIDRVPYDPREAAAKLGELRHAVLVATTAPVAFFAHPGKPSLVLPKECKVTSLVTPDGDVTDALQRLADATSAQGATMRLQGGAPAQAKDAGPITPLTLARGIAAHLPEQAIVADEGLTEGIFVRETCGSAPPHDWLLQTGGSIGLGLPLATGAAVACPERKVVCLSGDGSALYTIQALWTQARESLDVTTIILANHSYRILHRELKNVGAQPGGERARALLDLDRPQIDFVSVARGFGVPAIRVDDALAFAAAFARAMHEPGPKLIEAVMARDVR